MSRKRTNEERARDALVMAKSWIIDANAHMYERPRKAFNCAERARFWLQRHYTLSQTK